MVGTSTSARIGNSDVETVDDDRLIRSLVVEGSAGPGPWLRKVTETVALAPGSPAVGLTEMVWTVKSDCCATSTVKVVLPRSFDSSLWLAVLLTSAVAHM